MKKHWAGLILFTVILGSCASPAGDTEPAPSTETATSIPSRAGEQPVLPQMNVLNFEQVSPEPIRMDFPGGEALRHIGIVLYESQLYQAYVLAVNPGVSHGWYFAVSTDGVQWVVDPEPIEFPLADDKDNVSLNHLEPMANGGWRLITTHSVTSPSVQVIDPEIWAMTAESLQGPWVLDDEPLLAAGESGRWDQSGARFSVLFSDDARDYMLYFASDPSFQGLAVSDDGAAWRRTLPEGVTGPYQQEGNLIFMGRYDGMRYPQIVWRTPAGWQMIYYFSRELGDPSAGLRSSVSSDGVNWEPIEAEFHFENPHSNQTPGLVTPFWVEGRLYVAYCLWIEGENACYLARLVDALAE